ncbi:GAF domain-containing sensor histidine kinase [Baaleninema sp.]|uniref:GAF domain-containing sensor histidine kinase n=1 Tax=Baaleninema sp. TaxID=3101197 RepID=UPI003D02CFDF
MFPDRTDWPTCHAYDDSEPLPAIMQHAQTTLDQQQLIALGRTLQTLREEEEIDILVRTTLDYLKSEFDYPLIWIGLYDRLRHRLQGIGGTSPNGTDKLMRQQFALSPGDIMEQVVIQQRGATFADLREETRAGEWGTVAKQLGVQGTVVLPLCYRHLCFGVVLLGSTFWGQSPTADDRTRLSMVLGELATALYQQDLEQQRRSVKRPHEPLLSMMSQLSETVALDDRLNVIVDTTQQFLQPTRTHVYWFESDRQLFWLRSRASSTTRRRGDNDEASEIPLSEFGGFYKALTDDRVVAIGEAYSSLKADATSRLMYQIRARSLLAAPILFRGNLLGFLSVEGSEARIWSEEEKQYVRGAAQLVALTTPLSDLQERMDAIERDRDLTVGLTQTVAGSDDTTATLESYAERLCDRLEAKRVSVLSADLQTNQFEVVYEYPSTAGSPFESGVPPLSFVDWQLLERSENAIAIEAWELNSDSPTNSSFDGAGDMRLTAWQPAFVEAGLKALLIGNTTPGHLPEALLVVSGEGPRTWTVGDRELVTLASRQVGALLRQWQLQQKNQQHQTLVKELCNGSKELIDSQSLDDLEDRLLARLGRLLKVPFLSLVTWKPGAKTGYASAVYVGDPQYSMSGSPTISLKKDKLILKALSREGLVGPVPLERLPASSQRWLCHLTSLNVRALALRTTPGAKPTSVLVVGDYRNRPWERPQLEALQLFGMQLAWGRRTWLLGDLALGLRDRLEPLNWYKQRRFEELYRSLLARMKQLKPLQETMGTSQMSSLQQVRYEEIWRELEQNLTSVGQLLKQEQWELQPKEEGISIVKLFKQVLDLVEPTAEKRQIWMQVHREGNVTVYADPRQLSIVFYEVLTAACRRSQVGDRIDIWYRPLASDPGNFLELSVTDNGSIDSRLLKEFQRRTTSELQGCRDALATSSLDRPPGLRFLIFQRLMRQMGGDFLIEKLDDGRIVSRLLVPLSANASTANTSG